MANGQEARCDLAVVIVSHGSGDWLPACLRSVYARAGDLRIEVVIADNDPLAPVPRALREEFPSIRVIACENRGFGHGNNVAFAATGARYVLFLNPDTEIRSGRLEQLVAELDAHPEWGAIGCRQVGPHGELQPTIRRFPAVRRILAEAVGSEGLLRTRSPGLRVLDPRRYDQTASCDWIVGSFMLLRAEAFAGVGMFDERFFLFHEETDVCLRLHQAGWQICYSPLVEIVHYTDTGELGEQMAAQHALAHRQYVLKHFGKLRAAAYLAALGFGYALRGGFASVRSGGAERRRSLRRARRMLAGLEPPPFAVTDSQPGL
jgi:hypothetical protein